MTGASSLLVVLVCCCGAAAWKPERSLHQYDSFLSSHSSQASFKASSSLMSDYSNFTLPSSM